MRILDTGSRRVAAVIGKKLDPNRCYRPSAYTCLFSKDGICLLRNTLTSMTVALSEAERYLYENARKMPINGSQLCNGFEEFVEYGFFVKEDTEDYELYRQTVSILKLMSAEKPGTKTYTILPTTGCNARCVYCYEQGMPVYTMSEETADRVAEFVVKTRWEDKIKLVWFGGEPLVGSRIISRICRSLDEKNIAFRSKIITNATLMTPELLEEAVALWHLESAQVSVDGKREDYENRKQYVDPAKHDYDAMMDAVGRMLNKGIRVTLRCNYDRDNLDGIKLFVDDITARFGCPDNLSVYPAMLFQAKAGESSVELFQNIQHVNTRLRELGLRGKNSKPAEMKQSLCMADNGDKNVVISPDGRLYHCEHLPGNTAYGSVYDTQITVHSDERAKWDADEKCRTCCFLPECTPFFKNGCPDYFEYCRAFKQIETDEELSCLIQNNRLIS